MAEQARILEVAGDFEAMGRAHGDSMARQLNELFELRLRILCGPDASTLTMVRDVCKEMWRVVHADSPNVWLEADAARQSAGLLGWQMIVAGAFTDVADAVRVSLEEANECSVVTDQAKRVIYGTWDSHRYADRGSLILVRRPHDGPATLALTTAGWPAQYGVSSNACGFGITNLTPKAAARNGLPYIAVVPLLAGCESVDGALTMMDGLAFASGHSYELVTPEGAAILETSCKGFDARRFISGAAVQTNHYLSQIDDNGAYEFLSGSLRRKHEIETAATFIGSFEDLLAWLTQSRNVMRTDLDAPGSTQAVFWLDAAKGEISVRWPNLGLTARHRL